MGIEQGTLGVVSPKDSVKIPKRSALKVFGVAVVSFLTQSSIFELTENREKVLAFKETLFDNGIYIPRLDRFVEIKDGKLYKPKTDEQVDLSSLNEVRGGPFLMGLTSYSTEQMNGEYLIATPDTFKSEPWKQFINKIEKFAKRPTNNQPVEPSFPGANDVSDYVSALLDTKKISFKESAQHSRHLEKRLINGITPYDAVYLAHSAIAYFGSCSEPIFCPEVKKLLLLIPDWAGESYIIDPVDQGVIPYETYMNEYKIDEGNIKHLKPLFEPVVRLS